MQSGSQDQSTDLRLGPAEAQGTATGSQPAREHGQIQHQRHIRKGEFTQVHDHVGLRAKRARERLPPPSLCGPVLVSAAAQSRGLFTEVDDRRELYTNLASRCKPAALSVSAHAAMLAVPAHDRALR